MRKCVKITCKCMILASEDETGVKTSFFFIIKYQLEHHISFFFSCWKTIQSVMVMFNM